MALKIDDVKMRSRLPEIPRALPLPSVRFATLDERRWSIEAVGRRLGLGKTTAVEVPHGYVFSSARGEVEFFRASGGIWVCDTSVEEKFDNEARPWKGLQETGRGKDKALSLDRGQIAKLKDISIDLLGESGLLREEASRPTIELDQWAQLNEKGREIKRGAGTATVKIGYEIDGIPAIGPGSKTMLFAEPEDGAARITGLFHAWRDVDGMRELKLHSVERALSVGFLRDPELQSYHQRGHKIEISRITFGYFAFPVFMRQGHLFPAFQAEGVVHDPENKARSFSFGRYFHAAEPKQYAKADVAASYLFHPI